MRRRAVGTSSVSVHRRDQRRIGARQTQVERRRLPAVLGRDQRDTLVERGQPVHDLTRAVARTVVDH
jgi:hypothetical protein